MVQKFFNHVSHVTGPKHFAEVHADFLPADKFDQKYHHGEKENEEDHEIYSNPANCGPEPPLSVADIVAPIFGLVAKCHLLGRLADFLITVIPKE